MDALVEALERQNSLLRAPVSPCSPPLHPPIELYEKTSFETLKNSQRQKERKDKFLGRVWSRRGEEELGGKRGGGGGFFMSTCSPASSPCSLFCCASSSDTLASSSSSTGQMNSRCVEKKIKNTKKVVDEQSGGREAFSSYDKKEAEMKSRGRELQQREEEREDTGRRLPLNVHFYDKPDDVVKERSLPPETNTLSYYFPYKPWGDGGSERGEEKEEGKESSLQVHGGGMSSTLPSVTSLQDPPVKSKPSYPLFPSSSFSSSSYMNIPFESSTNASDHRSPLPFHGKQTYLYPSPCYPLFAPSSGTGIVPGGAAAAAEASPPGSLSPAVCTPGLPTGGGRTLSFFQS